MNTLLTLTRSVLPVIFFFVFYYIVNAQSFSGSVINYDTGKPIPYALITNTLKTIGVSADSSGKFYIKDLASFDSLSISSIGYRRLTTCIPSSVTFQEFKLVELPIVLNEVTVREPKELKTLGCSAKRLSASIGGEMNSNYELASLIPNPFHREGLLKSVSFYIAKGGVAKALFRIRIYENDNKKPGAEITTDNIVVSVKRRDSWNSFDLSKHTIYLPKEGFFVSMEWLNIPSNRYGASNNIPYEGGIGQYLGLASEYPVLATFARSNKGDWYSTKTIFVIQHTEFSVPEEQYPMVSVKAYF